MARAGGAPEWLFAATALTALAAGSAAWAIGRDRLRWLDGPRLALAAALLWSLGGVYDRIGGDGYEYYVPLRSAVLDGDADFTNDFDGLRAKRIYSAQGQITSRFPIGMAVVWAPPFLLTHAVVRLAAALGADVAADGFSPVYQAAVTTATFVYAALGLVLVEACLRRWFDRAVALLTVLAVWLATPLHFYMVVNPAMSHAVAAALAALLLVLWLKAREREGRGPWLAAGIAGAFLALVRIQDAVLLAVPLLDLLLGRRGDRLGRAAALLAPAVAAGAVQLAVWLAWYGPGFVPVVMIHTHTAKVAPQVVDFLFAARHGLFTWTPVYLACVAGWLLWLRRDRRLAGLFALAFAAETAINSATGEWWASDSFGQRRMVSLAPFFAVGLAETLTVLRRHPLVAPALGLAALAVWNLQFEGIYNAQLLAPRTKAVALDQLARAQADAAFRTLMRLEDRLPGRLWVLLYDNLRGLWLDEGARSLGGVVDLGNEPADFPQLVADGWYDPEREGDVTFRLSRIRRSWLRIPVRTVAPFRLTIRARRGVAALPVRARLSLNETVLGEAELQPEWAETTLEVPESAVRSGLNLLMIAYDATPRADLPGYHGKDAAAAVDWIRFERQGANPERPLDDPPRP